MSTRAPEWKEEGLEVECWIVLQCRLRPQSVDNLHACLLGSQTLGS